MVQFVHGCFSMVMRWIRSPPPLPPPPLLRSIIFITRVLLLIYRDVARRAANFTQAIAHYVFAHVMLLLLKDILFLSNTQEFLKKITFGYTVILICSENQSLFKTIFFLPRKEIV